MQVSVDIERCTGAGACALIAPEVFDQTDDTGLVLLRSKAPDFVVWDSVREAAMACPRSAILVTEDE